MIDQKRPGAMSPAGKFRLAIAMAVSGSAMAVAGLVLGRGKDEGLALLELRMFLLVIGFMLAGAGIIGLAAAHRSRRAGKGSG